MSNSASAIKANAQAGGSFYNLGLGTAVGLAPLLEQKIAVFAEGNADKQSEIAQDGGVLTPLTSLEVAAIAGFGSPAHMTAIMLFDNLAPGVTIKFFFVPENGSGTVSSWEMTGTGASITTTGVITLNIMGELVNVTLVSGQTLAQVLVTIKDAINAAINLPVEITTVTPTTLIDIDSKWKGQSAAELNVLVEANTSIGITFALVETAGAGEILPATELAKLTNDWFPHVLNCLGNGISEAILDEYEDFNGTPLASNGKYEPTNMTPYIAWTGTHEAVIATNAAITQSRLNKNTTNYLPLPNAQDWTFLNAAEALAMFVTKSNGDPKQDIQDDPMNFAIPPTDLDVGAIIDYDSRDVLVKAGCSTVNFKDGNYYTKDIITTYHPDGESDPIFRYVRDNMLSFNLIDQVKKYNERQKNKTIAPNALPSPSITSPDLYRAGILNEIIKPFTNAGYIADFDDAKDKLVVGINPTNSGRFDIVAPVLITSLLRIVATDVQVNKFFG